LYTGVIKPVFDAIGAAFTYLYDTFIYPFYLGVTLVIGLFAAAFEALYNVAIKPIADAIGAAMTWLWLNMIKPVVDGIVGGFEWVAAAFSSLWTDSVEPGINSLADGFTWLWENAIQPAIDFIVGGFQFMGDLIADIFEEVSKVVSDTFEGIVGIVRGPVNAVIDIVNLLIDALNSIKIDIPDWVPEWGGRSIGFNLARIPALAEGGYVDSPTTALIGEAGPEVVMPLDRFEQLMGISSGSGQTVNYYAAPNQSIDAERALLQAMQRAMVITGW
jgi:hypothetical protein